MPELLGGYARPTYRPSEDAFVQEHHQRRGFRLVEHTLAYLPDVHGFVDLNGGLAAKTVKIPWPTPWPATPRTASITDQCPECVAEYRLRGSPSTVRDF